MLLEASDCALVINLDKQTYAGNPENLADFENDPRYHLALGDITDGALISKLLEQHQPDALVNFAGESHVDRSIDGPADFIETNINGTFNILESFKAYHSSVSDDRKSGLRFLHVSTDEVYGSLGKDDPAFCETTPYAPNSPYSASKAGADHLVRAYHHTFGLPVLTTNCSNNYGPYQFPEKLIPKIILNLILGKDIPIYGDGKNEREWIHVYDHCAALYKIYKNGKAGDQINIGSDEIFTNIQIVKTLLKQFKKFNDNTFSKIAFVKDRPGHDMRYAIDSNKIKKQLHWKPKIKFIDGLEKTFDWYMSNQNYFKKLNKKDILKRLGTKN